jgi:hypothetical protein
MFRQFLKKAPSETYIIAFAVAGGVSAGGFVGVRKLVTDPDIKINKRKTSNHQSLDSAVVKKNDSIIASSYFI